MTKSDQIERARKLLAPVAPVAGSPWGTLGAAFIAATAAVLMAGVVILGPGVQFEDPTVEAPLR
ncbi:MAG TPA: peptidoglycan-binding protein [Brevundimonas sp.]